MTPEESRACSQHLGKFEGCAGYAAYFWDMVLEGGGDDWYDAGNRGHVEMFQVTEHDVELFPELEGVTRVDIWEDDVGFVHTLELTGQHLRGRVERGE